MNRLAMILGIGLTLTAMFNVSSFAQTAIDGAWVISTIDNALPNGFSETLVVAGDTFTYEMVITVNGNPTTITGDGTIRNTGGLDYLFTTIGRSGEELPMPMTLSSDGNSLTGSGGTPIKTFVYVRKR